MAQQKSEDRVVAEGGVMPAERAGSSPGGQGKAVPVEETALQLQLPIATAENPGAATRRASNPRDRFWGVRAGASEAIVNAETGAPATMREAGEHLKDGYEWVVDLGLEKFFDRVCHQRLMAKLAERVSDRRLLVLIGRMLKAKVVRSRRRRGSRRAGRFRRCCPTSCWTSST